MPPDFRQNPASPPVPVILGLGGNVGDVKTTFATAIRTLSDSSVSRPQANTATPNIRTSRLYVSSPWGVTDQPEFLNMAVEVAWSNDADALFELIRQIERESGRNRPDEKRWGPRTLDIDILLFDKLRIEQEALTVPHPRLHERRFVLLPLLDLLPEETILPGYHTSLSQLLDSCSDEGVVRALCDGPWEGWRETGLPT